MQDEINDKAVSLGIRVGKVTAAEISKALSAVAAQLRAGTKTAGRKLSGKTQDGLTHGRQTMKELARHNAGLSSVELKDPDLRQLYRTMKENGVDFSPVKDGGGKVTLFFKGRDADVLTHAFAQYTQKVTAADKKPSIRGTLAAMKQKAQELSAGRDRVKNLSKGAREI